MAAYILMIMMVGGDSKILFQEFNSLDSCRSAKIKVEAWIGWSSYNHAYCIKK